MSFNIPPGVLAQHVIALGKTGAGKSSALRVLVEGLLDDDKPVCIIDPKGDWWGIKSSANGKKAGFPVVVFGGEHADVPITEHSAAAIAELIATGNRSCLIDLGGWMVGERTRFFIAFASTLFKHTRGARHLVIDEVHNFAPQGKILDPDAGKMLHWANRLASEGRGKGVTIIAASQRPQKVHKDFVTSCETLIAMRVIHKLDRDSIKDWIDGCADPAKGREVLATLAQMKRGEAWIWSPEIEYGPERIAFPMFKTYDSFKPQAADVAKLQGWAAVDLDQVKAKLEKVVAEARASDPTILKKRIAELERLVATKPAVAADPQEAARHAAAYAKAYAAADEALAEVIQIHRAMQGFADELKAGIARLKSQRLPTPTKIKDMQPVDPVVRPMPPAQSHMNQIRPNHSGNGALSKAARAILSVLSQFPDGCEKGRLTLLTGYSYSGSFQNALSELRSNECIEGENNGVMRITNRGISFGPFPELPTGQALVDYWVNNPRFSKAARSILMVLADGSEMTADELCQRTGYTYSGSFQNALSELRTAGVIEGKNTDRMRMSREIV